MLCPVSHDSHIESKTSWFIPSHDAYRTVVMAYMTSNFHSFFLLTTFVSQGPEMCLSSEHQNPSKTSEKIGYFDRVTFSLR